MRRYIVTPDKHFPLHDKKAINCLVKIIEEVKPDGYIDLGDVGEWQGASHWQWAKKKRPPLEYQLPFIDKDIKDVNKGLDIIDEALDKVNVEEKHMIEGNHDDWMNKFVDEHPYMDSYKFNECTRLKERGYEFHPIGKMLKIGKLYFYHGHLYGGIYHARNHLLKLGCNVIYGHWHDIQQMSVTHVDGTKSAWAIGCLKDMSADANSWLGRRQTNWGHAISVVDFYGNGYFTNHVIQIINGKTTLIGKLIKGE